MDNDSNSIPLASRGKSGYTISTVKTSRYRELKEQEAARRLTVMRSRGTRKAAGQQRRVSLASGAKWRITNWHQVARAMAKWA